MNHQAHQERQEPGAESDRVARVVVDSAFKVHQALSAGLLESAYEHCLAHELSARGLSFRRQAPLPMAYEGARLDAGYRLDLLVEERLIVEFKAVEALTRLHGAQMLTYLKLSGLRLGLLINFNVALFKQGVRRFAL